MYSWVVGVAGCWVPAAHLPLFRSSDHMVHYRGNSWGGLKYSGGGVGWCWVVLGGVVWGGVVVVLGGVVGLCREGPPVELS